MSNIQLFQLSNNDNIISLFLNPKDNTVLAGTSNGKIIKIDAIFMNAYLTGKRIISSQIEDGFGFLSEINKVPLLYQLSDYIVKISENKDLETWNETKLPLSTNIFQEIYGTFTSPILNAGNDFVSWNTISWQQNIPTDTECSLYIRAASTYDLLLTTDWTLFLNSTASVINESLDDFSTSGQFIQFKAVMKTKTANITPSFYNLVISYSTNCATFFFTKKFILEKDANPQSLLLTAKTTTPQYTEVKFGITDSNTAKWEDYQIIDIDKLNEIPSDIKNKLKIGIKFLSYSPDYYPVVDEFSLMFKSEKQNLLNQ